MQPRLENLEVKKLVGKRLTMSVANNMTGKLWRSFIPNLSAITNKVSQDR